MTFISKLILGLAALPMCVTHATLGHTKTEADINNGYAIEETIDLQEQLFNDYYNDLTPDAKARISKEEFKMGYSCCGLSISDYVGSINANVTNDGFTEIKSSSGLVFASPTDYMKYEDADYIITDNHKRTESWKRENEYVPWPQVYTDKTYELNHSGGERAFGYYENGIDYGPRMPVYYGNNYEDRYLKYLREGDLIWDPIDRNNKGSVSSPDYDDDNIATHMGMIVNLAKVGWKTVDGVYNSFTYVETVEAIATGVRYGIFDDERILRWGTKVLKVRSGESERRGAVDFMLSQLGKPYTLAVFESNHPVPGRDREHWYCTELVFSAYYSVDINICKLSPYVSDTYYAQDGIVTCNVIADMIVNTYNAWVYSFDVYNHNYKFLVFDIINYSNFKYTIRISNDTDEDRIVAYGTILNNFGDIAANYLKKDMKNIYIPKNSYSDVTISESGGNTSIFAYYVEWEETYCTIAHRLNKTAKTLNQYNWSDKLKEPHVMVVANSDGTYKIQFNKPYDKIYNTNINLLPESDVNNWNYRLANAGKERTFVGGVGGTSQATWNATYYGAVFGVRDIEDSNGTFNIYKFRFNKDSGMVKKLANATNNVNYLRICCVKKNGNSWIIRVTNIEGFQREIRYCNTMVSESNAKNWTNLGSNDKFGSLWGYRSKDFTISTNGNNKFVTFSYVKGGKRYISYAKNLTDKGDDPNGGTLTMYKRVINA